MIFNQWKLLNLVISGDITTVFSIFRGYTLSKKVDYSNLYIVESIKEINYDWFYMDDLLMDIWCIGVYVVGVWYVDMWYMMIMIKVIIWSNFYHLKNKMTFLISILMCVFIWNMWLLIIDYLLISVWIFNEWVYDIIICIWLYVLVI